jgi:hypothetical protein|tara:strand:- start:95 stop:373 length:279 start_codon:yes stop_codon:yes gene_type:complete
MIVISKDDKYISTTWGASIRLEAGVPKEVGQDLGVFCLQEGCTEHKPDMIKNKKPSEPMNVKVAEVVEVEVEVKVEGVETPKKTTVKKTTKK